MGTATDVDGNVLYRGTSLFDFVIEDGEPVGYSYQSGGFARRVVASCGMACMRFAARRTRRTGRRGLIGVWPPASTEACPPTGPCNTLRIEGSGTMMVVLGTDAHKKTHTIVACDQAGAELGSVTVRATSEGHLQVVKWAARWEQRRWAIEDCRHISRRLEADLLAAGELVVRVPPKMMAGQRRAARTRGRVGSD